MRELGSSSFSFFSVATLKKLLFYILECFDLFSLFFFATVMKDSFLFGWIVFFFMECEVIHFSLIPEFLFARSLYIET